MYYKWTATGHLITWVSWVDDCVCFGLKHDVNDSVKYLLRQTKRLLEANLDSYLDQESKVASFAASAIREKNYLHA